MDRWTDMETPIHPHSLVSFPFLEAINYRFQNSALLQEALTHPSLSTGKAPTYERLEFLGDTVLSLLIAEQLLKLYTDEKEGAVAKRHAALVCGETVSAIARQIELGRYILMSEGENVNGGRENATNLENVLEALIGALYLDGGLEVVRRFITFHWEKQFKEMIMPPKDPKTRLQEWAQKHYKSIPSYQVIACTGPSHAPLFTVEVSIEGKMPFTAEGPSKRVAERVAAEQLYNHIQKEDI